MPPRGVHRALPVLGLTALALGALAWLAIGRLGGGTRPSAQALPDAQARPGANARPTPGDRSGDLPGSPGLVTPFDSAPGSGPEVASDDDGRSSATPAPSPAQPAPEPRGLEDGMEPPAVAAPRPVLPGRSGGRGRSRGTQDTDPDNLPYSTAATTHGERP